jgi:hypothetical protein
MVRSASGPGTGGQRLRLHALGGIDHSRRLHSV